MRIAIHQPNYLPWAGYFTKMIQCDKFVFLDDADMPGGQSYVSRVKINGVQGLHWLTVPIQRNFGQTIQEVKIADGRFTKKHMGALQANYGRTPFYHDVMDVLEPVLISPNNYLSSLNQALISAICKYLELEVACIQSSQLGIQTKGDERLIDIVRVLGGDIYLSGKGGIKYQDPEKFIQAGIQLEVRTYAPIQYRQIRAGFVPGLSILDSMFSLGKKTRNIIIYI
jgi:hypothetical protein